MILTTQAETDRWLAAHTEISKCIEALFAPVERLDLDRWIGPRECCAECDTATPGLRLDKKGHPREDCAECGGTGFLITTWGEAQTERWEAGERYGACGSQGEVEDNGPQVGPIVVVGGVEEHGHDLERQAKRAMVVFERRPAPTTPEAHSIGCGPSGIRAR